MCMVLCLRLKQRDYKPENRIDTEKAELIRNLIIDSNKVRLFGILLYVCLHYF
jgi:hypothetical protein